MDQGFITANQQVSQIKSRMALPAIAAPMFLVSNPELVIAACRAGVIGSFPTPNARTADDLRDWFTRITSALRDDPDAAPWAANVLTHSTSKRFDSDYELLLEFKPEVVITALGSPRRVVEGVHGYGGLVFADVNTVAYARKALDHGADGLVLVASGAGGHTGDITGFSFVPAVREFFDGPIILGGGIVDGAGVRAAEVFGADFAYLGTRFVVAKESMAPEEYRQMIVDATEEDLVLTNHYTGVPAHYLKASIVANGGDPDSMELTSDRSYDSQHEAEAWKMIWSAGQGVRTIEDTSSVADIVAELKLGYAAAEAR